jgi:hypothetical protein
MNQEQRINLYLTEVTNLRRDGNGILSAIDGSLVFPHQFDPRVDISVYDRRSLEEQVISVSSFDSGTHLIKSGGKYFYAVDFETVLR